LIAKVAEITKKMHDSGINHRDYYLCHFLLKTDKPAESLAIDDIDLYLFDLHRAQIRAAVPRRWRIKDLAGLYFSSLDAGLTRRDYYRFITYYEGRPLRSLTAAEWRLWQQVKKRGEQLYREHQA
jgi:heptose I phosphotransferase